MPDDNTNTTTTTPPPATADNSDAGAPVSDNTPEYTSILSDIINKISDSQNILIALSSDPSVDELASAIGLSIYLDKLGKHATAIYSGTTPNALEFLKPEDTFEHTVDSLQDFVIALSKEKADHLRYKLDGDFVKIYITPYRKKISKDDLGFSYGDFNIDLVLALNVLNGIDLDDALREHGRIMHDATIVNITNGNPGKFGEVEWSDKTASSVSEMIASLLLKSSDSKLEEAEATAFLTGIVAATNRFSNTKTTPATMQVSSELMESGANQQLVSKNITPDVANTLSSDAKKVKSKNEEKTPEIKTTHDSTELNIEHDEEADVAVDDTSGEPIKETTKEVIEEKVEEEPVKEEPNEDAALLDDLQAAAASLAQTGAETTPDTSNQPIKIEDGEPLPEPILPAPMPSLGFESSAKPNTEEASATPPVDFSADASTEETNKYGKMLEDALMSTNSEPSPAPEAIVNNPATLNTPTTPTEPEINGVPQINYATPADAEILPPPPAPPIESNDGFMPASVPVDPIIPAPATVATPEVAPITQASPLPTPVVEPLGSQPAMQDQVYTPQAADPGAFKIPGI